MSRANVCAENGVGAGGFVQVNMSYSTRGVLRGLHYQTRQAQAKLVSVAHGEIYDVIVDCRKSSSTFGKWIGVKLSAEGGEQLYVPEGFAHGFYVRSETAAVVYQCSDYYHPGYEFGVNFASPSLGIDWGFDASAPVMSDKDIALPAFENIAPENLPE
ncbi:MAG: dTDP-4-dehydrorhamnose 3,5-epimerase [Kiritimatiellaeota bacterium]|nr:dTDP-4-dehydrorhamnose 3,5-epimerase [Kiritimatiellota bacterium]